MRLACSVLVLALCLAVVGSCSAAPSVFLKLNANGTDIPGDSSVATMERADSIECLSFDMGVTQSRGPGGMATGRHSYAPITITKRLDRASVLLLKALTQNEPCQCEFRFFRAGPSGVEKHVYTVRLENAYISGIRQFVAPPGPGPQSVAEPQEEVSWVFGDIRWTWMDGGIEHTDGDVQTTALTGPDRDAPQPAQPGATPRKPALRLPETRRVRPQQ